MLYAHSAQTGKRLKMPVFKDFKIGLGNKAAFEASTRFYIETLNKELLDRKDDNEVVVLLTEFPYMQGYLCADESEFVNLDRGVRAVKHLAIHPRTKDNLRIVFIDRDKEVFDQAQLDRESNDYAHKDEEQNTGLELLFTFPDGTQSLVSELSQALREDIKGFRRISQTRPGYYTRQSDNQVKYLKRALKRRNLPDGRPILPKNSNSDRSLVVAITTALGIPEENILDPRNNALPYGMFRQYDLRYLFQNNLWVQKYGNVLLREFPHLYELFVK
jgi:hypothetical protein